MNPQDAIINALQNSMNAEPGTILRNRIFKSAADGTDTAYIPRRRYITARTLLAAAIITSFAITTAFATGVPGFIRSWYADNMTVSEYETGYLPYLDPDDVIEKGFFAVITIGGVVVTQHEVPIKLDSLKEAQDILTAPLLVPTCPENEKEPMIINEWRTNNRSLVEVTYIDGDFLSYNNGRYVLSLNNPGVFRIIQIFVGDEHVTFDLTEGFTETKVNNYEAFWIEGNINGLYWVQDGVLVGLFPLYDVDKNQAMKIAESLVPMR
jgi:hypothetical protein